MHHRECRHVNTGVFTLEGNEVIEQEGGDAGKELNAMSPKTSHFGVNVRFFA
jgi:hypothetical protein